MPKDKECPIYGWSEETKNKEIYAIHFKSGVHLYFKTYAQDVQDLQSGSVYKIACFVAGTLISTNKGLVPIEKIKLGDIVLSKDGYKKVTNTYEHNEKVITGGFPNGVKITATSNHPFFTKNRGWVEFGELNQNDVCVSLREWKLQKRLFYLKERFFTAFQNLWIIEKKIISETKAYLYMWSCGKNFIKEKFHMAMLFTIETLTLSTTGLETSNYLQGQNTQEFIKKQNGSNKRLGRISVTFVTWTSALEVLKKQRGLIALRDAAKIVISFLENALLAVRNIKHSQVLISGFVRKHTQTNTDTKVYNLEVEDSHTYFANGLLVHNCDEELPFNLFSELRSRITATNGYFSMVFTATIGQDEWRRTMEPANAEDELFPNALKQSVSIYDCLKYRDGTNSHWTPERIKEIENQCVTEAEIQRRVFGRFVVSSGLKVPGFERTRNIIPKQVIDPSWAVYTGTDIGSGGERGHPASIIFIAVRPDGKLGIIFKGWRGDGIETVSNDILEKHREMCMEDVISPDGEMKKVTKIYPVMKSYDWNAKDFFMISSRSGEGFTPADKRRDAGYGLMNTLFKLKMLVVMDDDPELQKLVVELTSLQEGTAKQMARDDMTDSLRYALMPIPWNFEGVVGELTKVEEKFTDERSSAQKHFDERLSGRLPEGNDEGRSFEDECAEWQTLIEGR